MTKKEQEIKRSIFLLKGKEVKLWTTYQAKFRPNDEAYLEGTVDSSTGTYLILKHVLLWNGIYRELYYQSIRGIGKIEIK